MIVNMKKMLVSIAILAFLLAGCGGAAKSPAASNPPPAKQESMTDLFAKGKNLPGITYDYVIDIVPIGADTIRPLC